MLLIKGGQVVLIDRTIEADILVDGNKITQIQSNISVDNATVIDAKGCMVMAGFVDIHTHLREPGFTSKEDIASGTHAAVKGGVTTLACMPNTKPIIDNKVTVEYLQNKIRETAKCRVYPIASATKGQQGEELTEYGILKKLGVVAVSDDGRPVANSRIFKNILEFAAECGITIISHAEDSELSANGDVHEGYHATIAGLRGIPRAAEDCAVARELAIAASVDAPIHFAHVSTSGAVQLIREAKARGQRVTAETAPHYFALSDELIIGYNTNTKVNPPLREKSDVAAIIEGIKDGTLDCIATDHAPHTMDDKNCEYAFATNGISGLETSFAVGYTYLVKQGHITINTLSKLMTYNPSRLLGIGTSKLDVGEIADIAIVSVDKEFVVDKNAFVSKGKNTPFDKTKLFGQIKYTIVDGEIKYKL